ncbi:hypothetical protein [Chromobacterium piscinae]|uniref:hypothetical protein n=1 Tax=Chromobacterium piscinae TaxID=686831 RepID=UPI00320B2BD2
MGNQINFFGLAKSSKKDVVGINYLTLTFHGKKTEIEDVHEKIRYQYWIEECNLYFVVLENAPYEGTSYKFCLLSENGEVKDCLDLIHEEGEEFFFMENGRLEGVDFLFGKGEKKYKVHISEVGKVGFGLIELKYRSLLGYLRPRKYLALIEL